MRLVIFAATELLMCAVANAFNIDGIYNGMPRGAAVERLKIIGVTTESGDDKITGGDYEIGICDNADVDSVTKQVGVWEFNARLEDMIRRHGQPIVELQSPDMDSLSLRWKLPDGSDFALKSGTNPKGRFHNLIVIDTALCKN